MSLKDFTLLAKLEALDLETHNIAKSSRKANATFFLLLSDIRLKHC